MFVHTCYVQPIQYTYVSKFGESLTDWSKPLTRHNSSRLAVYLTNATTNTLVDNKIRYICEIYCYI